MMSTLKKIKIDYSTYLLFFMAFLAGYIKNIAIILIIIFIHEFGHIFFFKIFNIPVEKIVIFPVGGITYVNKKIHERIYRDILISSGGILFQFILSLVVYYLYRGGIMVNSSYKLVNLYNLNIIIFNILPIIPLDGSKILQSILSKYLSYRKSLIMTILVSLVTLIVFMVVSLRLKINNLVLYGFLMMKLGEAIKNFKYIINKFYLERVMYDHYYDEIISNNQDLKSLRVNKYYFFRGPKAYVNEKKYIKEKIFFQNKS